MKSKQQNYRNQLKFYFDGIVFAKCCFFKTKRSINIGTYSKTFSIVPNTSITDVGFRTSLQLQKIGENMCTVFSDNKSSSLLVAKSHDNFIQSGMVFTNRRKMSKSSLAMPGEKKLNWQSKFGSITFSQCGKGMPVGGMNEKGLVVEQATLPGTEYLPKDSRPEISCLEAIQYILDMCDTTNDAVEAFKNFRISKNSWILHYYIFDNAGKKAIIEFINGEIAIYRDNDIAEPVITNTSYQLSVNDKYLNSIDLSDQYQKNSIERNRIVVRLLKDKSVKSMDECFKILGKVKRSDTIWQCVYDTKKKLISIKSIHNSSVYAIAFDSFDLSETSESLLCDLESSNSNTTFELYNRGKNRKNIEGFFNNDSIIKMMNLTDSESIINIFDNHIYGIENLNS